MSVPPDPSQMSPDERARFYRRQIDITDALDAVLAAARAVNGEVDAVYGEEYLQALSEAVAAYDAAVREED